jgi:hypothetical protein
VISRPAAEGSNKGMMRRMHKSLPNDLFKLTPTTTFVFASQIIVFVAAGATGDGY